MEQVKISEKDPVSLADVAVDLKMYFQCNITKSVWGVQSILISETRSAIENVAKTSIKPNLPRLLLNKMKSVDADPPLPLQESKKPNGV